MTTKRKEESGSSNPTVQELLTGAQQYHNAATTLLSAGGRAEAPLYFLYTHTIELALKAFLRSHGLFAPRIHTLSLLYSQCREIGLWIPDDFRNVIPLLESVNRVHGFRYIVFASTGLPEINYLREAVDNLMATVTEEVNQRPKEVVPIRGYLTVTVSKPVKK